MSSFFAEICLNVLIIVYFMLNGYFWRHLVLHLFTLAANYFHGPIKANEIPVFWHTKIIWKNFVLSFCDLIAVSFTWFKSPNSIFLEYQSFPNCIICNLRVRYPLEVFEALAQRVRYTATWRVLYIVKVTSTCWKLRLFWKSQVNFLGNERRSQVVGDQI